MMAVASNKAGCPREGKKYEISHRHHDVKLDRDAMRMGRLGDVADHFSNLKRPTVLGISADTNLVTTLPIHTGAKIQILERIGLQLPLQSSLATVETRRGDEYG